MSCASIKNETGDLVNKMKHRIITGVVLMAIALGCVLKGGVVFLVFGMMMSGVGLGELLKMSKVDRLWILPAVMVGGGAMVGAYFFPAFFDHDLTILMVLTLGVMMGYELLNRRLVMQSSDGMRALRCACIFALTCPFLILIRQSEHGLFWMIYCVGVIAASDTFALVGGKLVGKRLLTSISPKKTVEGAVIGFVMSGVVSVGMGVFGPLSMFGFSSFLGMFGMGLLVAFFAQMGDLHESLTKRIYQVKDSSQLLPGHGGVYDRIDSYLMVVPVVYYLVYDFFWI